MTKAFKLTLKIGGHPDLVVRGEFTDGEQRILHRYLEQYDQLTESKPLREGFPCRSSLKCEQGKGPEVETWLPDDDTRSILLHRLRPFILQKEPASFVTVSAIVRRCIDDLYIQQLLSEQRKLYDGRDGLQQMQIASNGVVVNSEKVLYKWLNSHEYHRDPDKSDAIAALFAGLPGDFMLAIMVSMLKDKIMAIRNVAALVSCLLGKTKNLTFQTRAKKPNETAENT